MHLIPTRLQQLYDAARRIGQHFDRSAEAIFDPCGLILQQPPVQGYYWCTPTSARTFASTGGDGVHYSYLQGPDIALDAAPVVMTMPANDQLNYVVAEGFDEFLGYFAAEDSDASTVGWGEVRTPASGNLETLGFANSPQPTRLNVVE
ncbi:MAG TPA: hypothetical protein VFK88_11510 [Gallionella sp.]|nr:hypothetical protein [Gallionella sp.]